MAQAENGRGPEKDRSPFVCVVQERRQGMNIEGFCCGSSLVGIKRHLVTCAISWVRFLAATLCKKGGNI